MGRWRNGQVAVAVVAATFAMTGATAVAGRATAAGAASAGAQVTTGAHSPAYLVYWDQNEEEDFYNSATGQLGQLIPPYNPNGQMCLIPDGSGRFVTAYNPTLPSQNNPGSNQPVMQPPIGMAVWDRNGDFSGQTIYVPGPYMLPGQTVGGDIPPDSTDNFNNDGTFTGCAFDPSRNLFAVDLGTAQGQFPSPDNGRLVEWFAPDYQSYCIIDGPTSGGVHARHVDGTGGLSQPGDIAFQNNGNLLVPEAGPASNPFGGRVLSFHRQSLPTSAADCGSDGLYPPSKLRTSVFIQGSSSLMPFPQSVAQDRTCRCWAVASTIGDPAIAWFSDKGQQVTSHGVVPGESIANVGGDPNGYNPFGLTFAPDGSAYFVDIHIVCSRAAHELRAGQQRGSHHARDVHERRAQRADHDRRGLQLPDQRDGVRAVEAGLPDPHRQRR